MGFVAELALTVVVLLLSTLFVTNFLSRLISWQLTSRYGTEIKVRSLGLFYARGIVISLPSTRISLEIESLQMISGFVQLVMLCLSRYRDNAIVKVKASSLSLGSGDFKLIIGSFWFEWSSKKMSFKCQGSKIESLIPLTYQDKSANVVHKVLEVTTFEINLDHESHERTYQFTEEVYFQWHPSFHIAACDLVTEVVNLVKKVKGKSSEESAGIQEPQPWSVLNVRGNGNISIGGLLSNCGQTIAFNATNFSLVIPAKKTMSIKSDAICMLCDDRQIIRCEDVDILMVTDKDGSCVVDRMSMEGPLEMERNRALLFSFSTVRITFPHHYNFAANFNEKFITMTKWVRNFHRKSPAKAEQKDNPTVAIDMAFRIQSATMEIGDDPFETKLRNNFELLEDEYHEKNKRQQVLNERIDSLRRTNFLPDEKYEELRTALSKKDADIYIQRHKKLYNTSSGLRHNLFTVLGENINVLAAADSSMTGYAKLVNIMKHRLDVASPYTEDVRFSTIWCRKVCASFGGLVCRLRDFPKPFMEVDKLQISGTLMGAEQEATTRARRMGFVDMGQSANSIPVERTMPTLKFYHDLTFKVDTWDYTHGACWEPVLAQLALAFELISRPSLDPSPALTWWDKMRLLFHGSLYVEALNLSLFFHGSLDPYNSTELIEIGFTRSLIQWLTGRIFVKGNVDFLVHTASKYDECRIVHLPNIDIQIYLDWACVGSQYDHHSVMPCAADKVPEYSSNQVHDSYRAFRSHNLNIKLSVESKQRPSEPTKQQKAEDVPSVLMYSSSIRWFENQKQIFSGLTRLTRRGPLFGNVKKRKLAFSRVFKKIRVSVHLHKLKGTYWSSFAKTWGCEILGNNLSHSAEHTLALVLLDDGLFRRPRPVWSMTYMNTEITDVEIWLYSNKVAVSAEEETGGDSRKYLLSISRVSYNRESKESIPEIEANEETPPTHRLVVHDLRGAWTKQNKDVCFALFDLFVMAQQLKRNLSTEALKMFKVEGQGPAQYNGSSPVRSRHSATSPGSTLNKGYAASMLQKLISDSENNPNIVYSEDVESEYCNEELKLKGVIACQDDDVIVKNWLIELINSQVMLRGCETSGYIIASAAKTQIWQKIHRPVWKDRTLYSKQSWVGSVEFMQYYATVDANLDSDIVWLSMVNIQEKDATTVSELPDLVGSSQSVGGVISETIHSENGSDSPNGSTVQLQRIISRCGCQFFFAGFSEDLDEDIISEVPPLPDEDDLLSLEPWEEETAVDYFTLMHHDLDVSTNSQQFEMIIDLVNNLLLYVEPHKKEAAEKQQNLRFKVQLNPDEDQRGPITEIQNELRQLVSIEKQREKDLYIVQRTLDEDKTLTSEQEDNLRKEQEAIEEETEECKAKINVLSDKLAMMIGCYKEALVTADKTRERQEAAAGGHFVASVIKRIEICFKQASWRLTDADGQLGLADLVLRNFLYLKIAKNDDSVEHSLELGDICVLNLLPNQIYKTVLQPTELKGNIPLDRHRALRIFCRERAPVAGISVKEHFEVNVIPLTIGITHAFFRTMLKFFFPDPEANGSENNDKSNKGGAKKRGQKKGDDASSSASTASGSIAATNSTINDKGDRVVLKNVLKQQLQSGTEIEKMRERAQRNQTFVYIKIPEVPIRVSYKGSKQKNIIADINNFVLMLPTIEYHNQTWTWLDLLMAIKNESRNRLVSQAVKQKLHIKTAFLSSSTPANADESCLPPLQVNQDEDEERKTRLLLGNVAVVSSNPPVKSKSPFSFLKRKEK